VSGELPKMITPHALWESMVEAGIFHKEDKIRQFVIVADEHSVRMFVEHYGDERMLKVSVTLAGIVVENVVAPEASEGGMR
jgi:hypothetical protein